MLLPRISQVLLILLSFGSFPWIQYATAQQQQPQPRTPPQRQSVTISGRVLFAGAMSEASSVQVKLLERGMLVHQTFTDTQGAFEFPNLRPTNFTLEVWTEGYEVVRRSVDLSLFLGSRIRFTILLEDTNQVEVQRPPDGETVSMRELQIPRKAHQAFTKGLRELNEKNRPDRSVSHFQKAIELYPAYDEAYVQLSLAYLYQDDNAAAQKTLENALVVNGRNARAHAVLGVVHLEQEEMAQSEEALREAVRLDPNDWLARLELGKVLLRLGNIEEAYAHVRRAHELNGQSPAVHFLLSNVSIRRRDYEIALTELDELLELYPDQTPWASRARRQRETLAAVAQGSEAAELPIEKRWEISMDAGRKAYDHQEYDQAECFLQIALEDAVAFGPKDARQAATLSLLGSVSSAQGHYTEAERHYRLSVATLEYTLGPVHPFLAVTLNNLAELYRMQGQYGPAEPLYQRSLAILEEALGPDHLSLATGLENYSALLRMTDRMEEAEKAAARAQAIRAKQAKAKPAP